MADVTALIDQQTAAIDALSGQADSFLQQLLGIANVQFSDGFNIDTLLPNQYDFNSVPQVSFPVFGGSGTIGTISTSPPPEAPNETFSTLIDVVVPQLLSSDLLAPTTQFTYFEAPYESILLDPLKLKLLDNLVNGGYGIDTADEVALFNRARDREVQAMLARVEDAGRLMAARGFPLPPGELAIHIDRAYQGFQDKVSSASRDITLERAKLFVENRQFTIREVKEVETVLIGFHNSVQERALNVARATVEFAIAIYNSQIARFRLFLDSAKITADVQIEQLRARAEQARVNLEIYRAKIVGYEADVRRQIETVRTQIERFRVTVEEGRAVNDGTIARASLQEKVIEATKQQNIQISTMTIQNAQAKLLATVEALKFKTGSAQYAAEKFYAQLTALVGTINTLAVQTATD